jgi:hypothetical protein
MTISSAYVPDTYAGTGSLDTFAITFAFLSVGTNVKVSVKVDSTGVITLKTAATHYNVTGSNVVFTAGNIPASGETVILELNPDFQQTSDYQENAAFPAATLETDLDERTLEGQINNDSVTRSLKIDADLAATVSTDIVATSSGAEIADKVVKVNGAGTGFEIADLGTLEAVTLPVSVANGGTGSASLTSDAVLTGTGTSAVTAESTVSVVAGVLTATSGATITGAVTLDNGATSAGSIDFKEDSDNGTNAVTLIGPASTADVTVTLPAATDTLVGKATTDTLTNKTIDANGTGNSISNIDVADLANGTDGELITWDAAGAPTVIDPGTATHILTSNGAGAPSSFQAAPAGDMVFISSATASASASIAFTDLSSTYRDYLLVLSNVYAATSAAELLVRTSTDNGSTYDSGASDYLWMTLRANTGLGTPLSTDDADTGIRIVEDANNSTNRRINGWVRLHDPAAALDTCVTYHTAYYTSGAVSRTIMGSGFRASAGDVDAVQVIFSAGNITSGTISLYGIIAS